MFLMCSKVTKGAENVVFQNYVVLMSSKFAIFKLIRVTNRYHSLYGYETNQKFIFFIYSSENVFYPLFGPF